MIQSRKKAVWHQWSSAPTSEAVILGEAAEEIDVIFLRLRGERRRKKQMDKRSGGGGGAELGERSCSKLSIHQNQFISFWATFADIFFKQKRSLQWMNNKQGRRNHLVPNSKNPEYSLPRRQSITFLNSMEAYFIFIKYLSKADNVHHPECSDLDERHIIRDSAPYAAARQTYIFQGFGGWSSGVCWDPLEHLRLRGLEKEEWHLCSSPTTSQGANRPKQAAKSQSDSPLFYEELTNNPAHTTTTFTPGEYPSWSWCRSSHNPTGAMNIGPTWEPAIATLVPWMQQQSKSGNLLGITA